MNYSLGLNPFCSMSSQVFSNSSFSLQIFLVFINRISTLSTIIFLSTLNSSFLTKSTFLSSENGCRLVQAPSKSRFRETTVSSVMCAKEVTASLTLMMFPWMSEKRCLFKALSSIWHFFVNLPIEIRACRLKFSIKFIIGVVICTRNTPLLLRIQILPSPSIWCHLNIWLGCNLQYYYSKGFLSLSISGARIALKFSTVGQLNSENTQEVLPGAFMEDSSNNPSMFAVQVFPHSSFIILMIFISD